MKASCAGGGASSGGTTRPKWAPSAFVVAPKRQTSVKVGYYSYITYKNLFDMSDVKAHLGAGNPHPERKLVSRNVVQGLDVGHTVVVHCRDNYRNDGSVANLSIKAATKDYEGV
ncbi:hypothetical protein ACEPPN_009123 [Leptodophora sp. 'Broadleaf-Isolate-01']